MIFETWFENIHSDDKERVFAAQRRVFKSKRFDEEMQVFHPKKRTWRWIHAIFTAVHDRDGSPKYVNGVMIDISDKKKAEEALKRRDQELEERNRLLQETNIALDVLLKKREKDQKELEESVVMNLQELVEPMLRELSLRLTDKKEKACLAALELTLKDIISPFSRKLSSRYRKFSPTEIQIADLIRHGKSTKEISLLLGISVRTVEGHRKSIRKKSGIVNEKVNLKTHLQSVLE